MIVTRSKREALEMAYPEDTVYQISDRRYVVTGYSESILKTVLDCDGIWYDARAGGITVVIPRKL